MTVVELREARKCIVYWTRFARQSWPRPSARSKLLFRVCAQRPTRESHSTWTGDAMSTLLNWARRTVPSRLREKLHVGLNQALALFQPEPYRTVLPYTMVGMKRLKTLDRLARTIDRLNLPGDVVECGTCNGGSAAVLARVACRSPLGRHVWLLDSFAGLPPAGDKDGAEALTYTGLCCGSLDRVKDVLRRVGVPAERVTAVPGWFADTVPAADGPADRSAAPGRRLVRLGAPVPGAPVRSRDAGRVRRFRRLRLLGRLSEGLGGVSVTARPGHRRDGY